MTQKEVRKELFNYFYFNDISFSCFEIHKINPTIRGNNINVDILLSRPGIFIGSGGENIEKIKNFLKERLSKDIIINIIEFCPFNED